MSASTGLNHRGPEAGRIGIEGAGVFLSVQGPPCQPRDPVAQSVLRSRSGLAFSDGVAQQRDRVSANARASGAPAESLAASTQAWSTDASGRMKLELAVDND